jgi:hypothetical protein
MYRIFNLFNSVLHTSSEFLDDICITFSSLFVCGWFLLLYRFTTPAFSSVQKRTKIQDNAGRILAMEAALPYLEMLRMLEQAYIQVSCYN